MNVDVEANKQAGIVPGMKIPRNIKIGNQIPIFCMKLKKEKETIMNNGSKPRLTRGGYFSVEETLSFKNTECLKGIFAVFILAHHLYQSSGVLRGTLIGYGLQALGYLSVAVFFFLSGYGLAYKSMEADGTNSNDYIRSFPKRRLLPYYMIYVLTSCVYAGLNVVEHGEINLRTAMRIFGIGNSIIMNGWYLQALFLLYLVFYLVYRIPVTYDVELLTVSTVLICISLCLLGKESLWYESMLAFPLGFWLFRCRERITEKLRKGWFCYWLLLGIFMLFLMIFGNTGYVTLPDVIRIPLKMLSALCFVAFIILTVMKVRIESKATRLLSHYYFEIYTMQGIALTLFQSVWRIDEPCIYIICSVLVTALLAMIIHPVYQVISKAIKGGARCKEKSERGGQCNVKYE